MAGDIDAAGAQIGDSSPKFCWLARGVQVEGSVYLNEDFKACGVVDFGGSHIRGRFVLQGEINPRGGSTEQSDNLLILGASHIGWHLKMSSTTIAGNISLRGATVEGNLECKSVDVKGDFKANNLRVGRSVELIDINKVERQPNPASPEASERSQSLSFRDRICRIIEKIFKTICPAQSEPPDTSQSNGQPRGHGDEAASDLSKTEGTPQSNGQPGPQGTNSRTTSGSPATQNNQTQAGLQQHPEPPRAVIDLSDSEIGHSLKVRAAFSKFIMTNSTVKGEFSFERLEGNSNSLPNKNSASSSGFWYKIKHWLREKLIGFWYAIKRWFLERSFLSGIKSFSSIIDKECSVDINLSHSHVHTWDDKYVFPENDNQNTSQNQEPGFLWNLTKKQINRMAQYQLQGFTYENLGDNLLKYVRKDPRAIGIWLNFSKICEYQPQPYEQMAEVLKKHGEDEVWAAVIVAKRREYRQYGLYGILSLWVALVLSISVLVLKYQIDYPAIFSIF